MSGIMDIYDQSLTPMQKYQKAVDLGKELVSGMTSHQCKIAHLACQVCEIRHGGISNGIYTLKNFAQDIGMSHKTLQEYVTIYRRVIKVLGIHPEVCTPSQWRNASRVRRSHELQNSVTRRANGTVGRLTGVTKRTPEEIKREFQALESGVQPDKHKITNWNSELLYIANNLSKTNLHDVDIHMVQEMLYHSMVIKNHLDTFLTSQQKKSA